MSVGYSVLSYAFGLGYMVSRVQHGFNAMLTRLWYIIIYIHI